MGTTLSLKKQLVKYSCHLLEISDSDSLSEFIAAEVSIDTIDHACIHVQFAVYTVHIDI